MAEGQVTIEVLLDSKQFQQGISKLSGMASKGLAPIGKAAAAATGAVTGVAGAAVRAGIEYESAFAGVRKTIDATEEEYEKLSNQIRDMAKEMPQSAAAIAGVAEAAGQLGIDPKNVAEFTKTMVQMGDATNMTSEEVATSSARFANIMGMSQDNFDKLGSTVVALGNNMATTESEIMAMGLRIAGAGRQVNMSEAQVMSWSAAMSSVGINAEAGGTAFSNGIKKINAAVSEGGTELQKFADVAGMSKEEFATLFKEDSSAAMQEFVKGLAETSASGGDLLGLLNDIGFSDVRISDTFARMAGGIDVVNDALKIGNDSWNENTALTKEVENRYSTLESQISMLKNQVVDVGIEIFQSTKGPLNDAVKGASTAVKGIADAYKKGGATAAASAAGEALGKMIAGASKYVPKMAELGVKALKAFARGVIKNRKAIADAAKQLVRTLADSIGDMLPDQLGRAFKNIGKMVSASIDPMMKVAGVAAKVAGSMANLLPVITGVVAAFKGYSVINNFMAAMGMLMTGQKAATASTLANTAAMRVNSAQKTIAAAKTTLLTGVTTGMTAAQTAATVATNGLRAALAFLGGPVGIIVTALGALAGAALIFGDSFKASSGVSKQTKEIQALSKEVDNLSKSYADNKKMREESLDDVQAEANMADDYSKRLEELAGNHNKTAGEIAEEKRIVEQLNDLIPDLNLKYDEQADSLNKTTDEIKKKVEAMKEEAKAAALTDIIKDTYKEQEQAKKREREATEELAAAEEDYQKKKANYEANKKTRFGAEVNTQERTDFLESEKNLKELQASKQKASDLVAQTQADITYYEQQYDGMLSGTTQKAEEAVINLDTVAAEAGIKASTIPQSIYQGIQNGIYAMPTTGAELQNLIKFDQMKADAAAAGIEIPQSITQGMAQGGPAMQTAMAQMTNLVNFAPLAQKFKQNGGTLPASLVSGIASGKVAIPKTMKELESLVKMNTKPAGKKSGKDFADSYSSSAKSNKGKISKATEDSTKEASKGADKGTKDFSKAGSKSGDEYASGIKKSKGKVSSAAKSLATAAIKALQSGKSGARTAGSQMGTGLVSGLRSGSSSLAAVARSIVRNAINAMNSEADSHSPSKKTMSLGKFMHQGLEIGLSSGRKKVAKTASGLVATALKAAENVKGNYSKIGENVVSKMESSIEKQDKTIIKSINKMVKKVEKGAKKGQKKAVTKAMSAITSQLEKTLEDQKKKLVAKAESTFKAVSDKYQKSYDELVSKRDSLTSTLRSYGSMLAETANSSFTATFGRINDGSLTAAIAKRMKDSDAFDKLYRQLKNKLPNDLMTEILGLGDTEALKVLKKFSTMTEAQLKLYVKQYTVYRDRIKKINEEAVPATDKDVLSVLMDNKTAKDKFKNYVNRLKKYANTQELREKVLGMGVDEGTKFLEQFFSMSEDRRKTYIKTWNADYKASAGFAASYYKDQFATIKTNYNKEMAAAKKSFNATMATVGKSTMDGFIAGLRAKAKSASGTMKSIINQAIKAAKKALKIKSPSRVFSEIGRLTIEGAEVGSQKEARNLYTAADRIAGSFTDRFKAAMTETSIADHFANIKSAAVQMQQMSPLLKNQLQPAFAGGEIPDENRIYELHLHTDLNGREIAHETARFMNQELGQIKELNNR